MPNKELLKAQNARLFRNLLKLPASHELGRKHRRQQTDDREDGARFRNRIHHQSPLFKTAIALEVAIAEVAIHVNEIARGRARECADRDEGKHVARSAAMVSSSIH